MYVVSLVIGYLSYASSFHEKAEILLKLLCFGREKSSSFALWDGSLRICLVHVF